MFHGGCYSQVNAELFDSEDGVDAGRLDELKRLTAAAVRNVLDATES